MPVYLAEVWSAAAEAWLPALTWSGWKRFWVFAGLCVLALAAPAHWAPGNVGSAPGPSGSPQDQWAGTQSSQAQSPLFPTRSQEVGTLGLRKEEGSAWGHRGEAAAGLGGPPRARRSLNG